MAKKTVFQYPGKKATVSWHGRLCIHVAECGRAKGDLFIGGRDPWCQPDLATDEEIADVIRRCPTGALTVDFEDGSGAEQPEPVDLFTCENRQDKFRFAGAKKARSTEPVLVTEAFHGQPIDVRGVRNLSLRPGLDTRDLIGHVG